MNNLKKMIVLLAAVLMLGACSGETKNSNNTDKVAKNEGSEAPTFELVDVNGKTHNLADYKGQKVYVKFWASWCSICLAGLEELNTLAGEEQDFVVLTIVSPGFNNEKKTDAFIKWFSGVEEASNITVLLDEDGTVAKQFGVRAYPTSSYIGSDGTLIQTLPGHVSNEHIIETFKGIE
ncbi:redoxin family protein [Lysinibacillus sp. KU-BSD001]|uniref:redoxin family protein n=1 Tax=Lysinibacillus sp. KU-BSD001 TaxID=3141328 RepID=UPI0036DFA6D7